MYTYLLSTHGYLCWWKCYFTCVCAYLSKYWWYVCLARLLIFAWKYCSYKLVVSGPEPKRIASPTITNIQVTFSYFFHWKWLVIMKWNMLHIMNISSLICHSLETGIPGSPDSNGQGNSSPLATMQCNQIDADAGGIYYIWIAFL